MGTLLIFPIYLILGAEKDPKSSSQQTKPNFKNSSFPTPSWFTSNIRDDKQGLHTRVLEKTDRSTEGSFEIFFTCLSFHQHFSYSPLSPTSTFSYICPNGEEDRKEAKGVRWCWWFIGLQSTFLDCWIFNGTLTLLNLIEQCMGLVQFICHLPNKINELACISFITTWTLLNLL